MLDIIKNRLYYFGFSAFLVFLSFVFIFLMPLNYGIDMTGGTQTEFTFKGEIDFNKIRADVESIAGEIKNDGKTIINSTSVYKVTGENKFIIEAGFDKLLGDNSLEDYKNNFKTEVSEYLIENNNSIEFSKYINIGASFGDYIKKTAKTTLIIAIFGIALYVAYAFSNSVGGISSMSFATVTIITLFHDVLIATGLYIFISSVFPEFKIDTFFITALLTILGYSINDTIVVSDRIRANLKLFGGKKKKLKEIINISVNETVSRSIYTSLTLFFVLISILVFGPESIAGFTMVLIFGTVVGTYSSIFIASPLLYEFNKNKKLTVYKKKKVNQDDLIVV